MKEGYSIASQLELLRTYCSANGIEVVSECVEAETAKEAGRRMFGEMLDLARRGGIAAIVVEETDRLYRTSTAIARATEVPARSRSCGRNP
jgi:DNA invertase Pin-like site-specific DNA recombinase